MIKVENNQAIDLHKLFSSIELKKENDFLHLRLQHLTKENEKLTRFRDQETLMREKLEYYE